MAFTVSHYDFTIDLTTRATDAKVTLQVTTAGDCLAIPYRGGSVTSVTLNGGAADGVSVDAQQLLHACDAQQLGYPPVRRSCSTQTTEPLLQEADLQVGFGTYPDLEGNSFTYLVSWVGGLRSALALQLRARPLCHLPLHRDPSLGHPGPMPGDGNPGRHVDHLRLRVSRWADLLHLRNRGFTFLADDRPGRAEWSPCHAL